MKHLLLTTIAAVVLVGCGKSQQSAPAPETPPAEPVAEVPAQPSSPQVEAELTEPVAEAAQPEPTTPKAPDISLLKAAIVGNIEAVKQHLANGTDVNAKDENGYTPLHPAALNGHKEIVELLINKGADVNAKNSDGGTPLDLAILRNNKEITDLLRKHGGKAKTPDISIHEAAEAGNIEAVKQHLADGADVNAKDGIGGTPLYIAAFYGSQSTRNLLRNPAAKTGVYDGWTPLNYAAFVGRKEIAELLIAAGADVNTKDDDGETPLDWAEKVRYADRPFTLAAKKETAELLRKHGGKTAKELEAEGK